MNKLAMPNHELLLRDPDYVRRLLREQGLSEQDVLRHMQALESQAKSRETD